MTITKTTLKALLGASALTAFSAVAAHAGGTAADTVVKNTFTLNYQVSGVPQPVIETCKTGDAGCTTETSTNFTVDRLVDLTVASNGNTTVAPGATNESLIFSLTNEGNDTHGYELSTFDNTGDDFSATSVSMFYYIDDGDGLFNPGTGPGQDGLPIAYNGTHTPDLDPDAVLWIAIEGDIPSGANDTDVDTWTLIANTLEVEGGGGTAGTEVTGDGDGNSLLGVAENVLADGTGTSQELANQGDHSAAANYVVASADVAGAKAVLVYSQDGTGCTTFAGTPDNGYAIPGACVEYTITVSNAGAVDATNMVINDILDTNLAFMGVELAGFTGTPVYVPALPTPGLVSGDCDVVTCEINLTGVSIAGTTGAPNVATVRIHALVK